MWIKSVSIGNYKSFNARQDISFQQGFNLLLGLNNAGKTSVLDVLDLPSGLNQPHRSERSIPQYGGLPPQGSHYKASIATTFEELWLLSGASQLYLPVAADVSHRGSMGPVIADLENFAAQNKSIELNLSVDSGKDVVHFKSASMLIQGKCSATNPEDPVMAALFQAQYGTSKVKVDCSAYRVSQLIGTYPRLFQPKIYRFSAQRRPGFQGPAQHSALLDREAVNLPYCLNNFQTTDEYGYKTLCGWINRVFPSVNWVQATSGPNGFEVKCLPSLTAARRDDLALPMSAMGSGIGNVIAMLYVVMTARSPQVIAIDEPNAFLHPRALRELLAILESEGKQHQFILTAHSADVLTAVNAATISMLKFDGVATTVEQLGMRDFHRVRGEMAELGIRMTDLHAKDRVLWVEGQTEELVMPALLRYACQEIAAGTAILRVEQTGTFNKKSIDPKEVASIYEKLSTSSSIAPPMVGILLDGEARPKELKEKLEKDSNGKLCFLDRSMLESYLLHPEAIAHALEEMGVKALQEDVKKVIDQTIVTSSLQEIDAATVLADLFSGLSNSAVEFRKTRDVPTLVDWTLLNDASFLDPLKKCLRRVCKLDA